MRSKLSRQIFTTISVTLILVILLACGGYLLASYLNVRSTLSSFSQQYARQLEDMDYVYELAQSANMFPTRSVIIFIYSSDGNLIASNAPPPENANLGDLQTAASGGEVFNTVEYDGITMYDLAKIGRFDKGTVTKAVQKLIEEGYVISETDENDRRVKHLHITPKSIPVIELIYELRDRWKYIIIKDISIKDEEKLKFLLKEIAENSCEAMKDINLRKVR